MAVALEATDWGAHDIDSVIITDIVIIYVSKELRSIL